MKIEIVTIFPEIIENYLKFGIVNKAIKNSLVEIKVHNLRDYTNDIHKRVDDYAYGGSPGMVMKAEPLIKAVEDISIPFAKVILTSPKGKMFNIDLANELKDHDQLIMICGRYRGVDQRFIDKCVDLEISIGNFILSGGELPTLIMTESIVRLIPGVLNSKDNLNRDSFSDGCYEEELYTRPQVVRGIKVPEVLLSGNHSKISQWEKSRRKKIKEEKICK